MDRGAWWATVHGVAESDMTERLTHKIEEILDGAGYTLSTVPSPAGSWPWANKRLSCLLAKKKKKKQGTEQHVKDADIHIHGYTN